MANYISKLLISITAALFLLQAPVYSQEEADSSPSPAPTQALETIDSLKSILQTIEQHKAQIKSLQGELKTSAARGREEQIKAEIQGYSERVNELESSFQEVSTGVAAELVTEKPSEKSIDLLAEFRDLLKPLLLEMKRVTSRPREMSRLRAQIELTTSRLSMVEKALKNLDGLIEDSESKPLLKRLKSERSEWLALKQELSTDLSVAKQRLDHHEAGQKTLGQSLEQLFQIFFKSRGRNFVVALLVMLLAWVVCRRLLNIFTRRGPLSRHQEAFATKLFNILFGLFTVIVSALAFLMVLYFFGDWLLLTLAVLFLFGLIWTSREAIPHFWTQGMLLLNMGAVREGERVVYNGLPWKVRALNFYSQLQNPRLRGGFIRLPIGDLEGLRSRPFSVDEPWFPTEEGDWVLLSDGTYAEVVMQSIESVVLKLKGGSQRAISSADFVAMNPENLAHGFRISTKFGIDYMHQKVVTNQALTIFEEAVVSGLKDDGIMENEVKVTVEFAEAGASSLDVAVITDFAGKYDKDYQVLKRRIQTICVDTCTENDWVIPFTQMTVHMAETPA